MWRVILKTNVEVVTSTVWCWAGSMRCLGKAILRALTLSPCNRSIIFCEAAYEFRQSCSLTLIHCSRAVHLLLYAENSWGVPGPPQIITMGTWFCPYIPLKSHSSCHTTVFISCWARKERLFCWRCPWNSLQLQTEVCTVSCKQKSHFPSHAVF